MASSSPPGSPKIDKLDFDSHRQRRPSNASTSPRPTGLLAPDDDFLSDVVDGAVALDRRKMALKVTKYTSFVCAILSCLCAGSITAFSLYGPLFISHLKYSQAQVNSISVAAELAMYLPIPLFGWFCDRYGPRPLSLVAALLFGAGYLLAALTYHAGPTTLGEEKLGDNESHLSLEKTFHQGWPFGIMILGFVGVGAGTCTMYLSAVATCAKNFGRGKHKGLALAMPIAAFGLSGMWQSQVGSHFFQETDGSGDTDVFRYFIFLAALLFAVGVVGTFGLRVVGEEEMIDEAVEQMEQSGLLEESPFFQPRYTGASTEQQDHHEHHHGYGAIESDRRSTSSSLRPIYDPTTAQKKRRLLNRETTLFLRDHTMWLLTLGFFLTTGPGETYINNVGTLIHTLYPPSTSKIPSYNSSATHVSIIAATSTLARLATGILADILSPNPKDPYKKYTVSRFYWLFAATVLFSLAQLLLATPLLQARPDIFPLISSLVGIGYGAIFSLTPMLLSVVWGVENFATNWGIVAVVPAIGAAIWGAIYSAVYQAGVASKEWQAKKGTELDEDKQCYGGQCYQRTFLAMAVASWLAILLWAFAWRGWKRRGCVV
ncbi:MAG: putative monocarboxylate transporter mch1 [Ramalina farinacea]|uniref:Probable transporter MCH1 n=1 Tax=Ramalina farinacea TaxID=258253 RepID=A0AA43QJ38_9LECA|nr:putative monocarboxylate transporter mch1 [Ramalina farinacea]